MNNSPETPDSQTVLNQLVIDYMREQKRKRRWRWFYRIVVIILVLVAAYKIMSLTNEVKEGNDKPHVGLVDINGTIFDKQAAGSGNFVKSMKSAYKSKGLKAVILRINSPGGSPVQADYMYNTVQYYRKSFPNIKIHAVCVDMCTSAAYYIASAAEDIYANESSMVGSIGVLYNGFGFVDTLQKLGVTRRLQTAGSNKGFLDPFSPIEPSQEQFLQVMLNDIHQQFIKKVKEGRGTRLKIDDQIFSGLFWTGMQAKERGLIDGFASSGQLARDVIKINKIIDYTYKESLFEQVSKNIGTALADQLPKALGLNAGITA
jgi:protease-4